MAVFVIIFLFLWVRYSSLFLNCLPVYMCFLTYEGLSGSVRNVLIDMSLCVFLPVLLCRSVVCGCVWDVSGVRIRGRKSCVHPTPAESTREPRAASQGPKLRNLGR